MANPAVRLKMQFRTFMLGSWDAQFMSNSYALMQGDRARALAYFSSSMFAAAIAHTLRVSLVAAGMPEEQRKQYLDRMLSPKALAAASFSRAGWSSFLPGAIDTVIQPLGFDPLFSYRSTGLSQDIFGNPAIDMIDDIYNGAGSVGRSLRDGRTLSKHEVTSFTNGLLPFQNFIPLVWLQSRMVKDLPDHARK
jgi:hypothetical protein